MKKRVFSFLMALVMVLSMVPGSVFAAGSDSANGGSRAGEGADERLPIHFFVTTLDQAQNRLGTYQNYKQSLWGKQNGGASDSVGAYAVADILELAPEIESDEDGIRAHMVESDILRFVAQWPDGGTADDFRKLDKNYTFGGVSYDKEKYEVQWVTICWRNDSYGWGDYRHCGCGARYDHIHIDGILTQKIHVEEDTLTLIKEIPAQAEDQTFYFTLYQLELDSSYKPTNQTVGSGIPMIATVPAGSTTANIVPVDPNVTINTGNYYKLVENPSDKWMPSGVKIGNNANTNASSIYIWLNTNGTIQYSTNYNSGYRSAESATIVNQLIPTTQINVTKVWNDANNQDGIRPDSVEVHLLRNGVHNGNPVTLSAANGWKATWEVPTVDENGNAITWAVEESQTNGYTAVVTGNAADGFVITNTHVTERTSIQVHKVWTDDNNRDGVRPYGVKVQLYCNGNPVENYTDSNGNTVSGIATLTAGTSWTKQWFDLEKNKVGVENEYTVVEIGYVDAQGNDVANPGYDVQYGTDETGRLVVENIHEVGKVNVSVSKVWNDEDNRDGIRPGSVTLTLYANGIKTSATAVLNEANGWAYTWTGLYEYYQGKKITYTVQEDTVPSGYTAAVTGNAESGFTVTNTHVSEKINVTANKVWDDNDNQDGKRPSSVTLTLYADGVSTGKTAVANAGNNWTVTFEGMDKFRTGKVGEEIVYTVKEENIPAGYTSVDNGTGLTVTNKYEPVLVDLNVEKVWKDSNNQDGKRPYAVVITLFENGKPTDKTLTLSAANGWKGSWDGMPRYHNGQRISYTVVETGYYMTEGGQLIPGVPAGYTVTHDYKTATESDREGLATVTNSYTPEKTAINIQKIWDDDDNREGKRPASVTVELYQKIGENGQWTSTGKTTVLSPSNEWDADFTDLPKYSGGQKITYNVVELNVPNDYTPSYAYDETQGVVTVTNTLEISKIDISATKVWNDASNQDNIRPAEVVLTLYANGIQTSSTVTVSAANNWTAQWTDLYEYYNGKKITYTVVEENVPTGYTVAVTGTMAGGFTVTNTYTPKTVSVPVNKVWVDADDQDGIRPDSITVTLFADGVAVQTMALSASVNWAGSFQNLPEYKIVNGQGGVKIVYTVDEVTVPNGYTKTVNGNTITNTHEVEKTQLSAIKVWDDAANQDGKRPASITLHLMANGVHMGANYKAVVTPDSNGNWTYTWTGLDKFAEGKEINYTVYEEPVGNDYTASYSRDNNGNVIITNKRDVDKTSHTVQKVWVDANNQDNLRPYGIVVELLADGQSTGQTAVLTAENHWRAGWTGLNANANSQRITYTTKEVGYYLTAQDAETGATAMRPGVPAGYTQTADVDPQGTGIYIITNTHEVEKTQVTVTKVWDDADNQDGKRPASVTVTLYRNGVATNTTAVLNAANNWSYTFEKLDVHHGIGVDNVYTVVESNVPAGYTSVTTGDAATGFTIKNSYTPELVNVNITKIWNDANDQDGKRPDSITVRLQRNVGDTQWETTNQVLTIYAEDNWVGAFKNLPKYEDGKLIRYAVTEINVAAGYNPGVSTPDGYYTFDITNTHEPIQITLNVEKVWDDENNNDGKRPYAVVITLYENGKATNKTVTLNAANGWKDTFGQMPMYYNGQRISYSVVETGYYMADNGQLIPGLPAGYTVTHSYQSATEANPVGTATVTNSYTPEKTALNVQKVWNDDDNREGKRPASVTVELYADGVATGITATLSSDIEWDYTFTDLAKYSGGVLIDYSVVETPVDGYQAPAYSTDPATGVVTITNTRLVNKNVSVNVTKVWQDANNQDGIRPASIVVYLYANGIKTSSFVTLDESNNWTGAFTGLLEFYKGEKIHYTAVEDGAPEGYTVSSASVTEQVTDPVTGRPTDKITTTITNSYTPATVSIPVGKTWDDNDDQDGKRPDRIVVALQANGSPAKDAQGNPIVLTLTAEDNWQGIFADLPKFANGNEIVYTIVEAVMAGYNVDANGVAQELIIPVVNGKFSITNLHEIEKTQMTVIKVWNDANDQDGKRPASITLHLLANGIHMGVDYKVVLTETTWTRYTTDAAGNEVVAATGDNAKAWTYTWTDLDLNAAGEPIAYTVYEEPVYFKGVNPSVSNAARAVLRYTASYVRDSATQITVTNTCVPETTVVTAMKVWEDGNDRDGMRPEGITVSLFADGQDTGKTVTLNEANNWTVSWTDLAKYRDHGVEIVYTVVEQNIPEGYSVQVVQEEYDTGLFILTNTHAPATTGVSVTKHWNDENNNDGKRPDGIIVQLFANGSKVDGAKVVLNDANRWSYEWTSVNDEPLFVYQSGEKISYYVKEIGYVIGEKEYEGLPEGYVATTDADGYTVDITNARESEKTSVSVTKVWADQDNNDGMRPESVKVTLYRNGEILQVVELNEANGWAYTWKNLYKYVSGVEAVYTIVESDVEGYEASYTESVGEKCVAWTVTNTHENVTKETTVTKAWVDENNAEKLRPDSVTVQLYCNGEAYGDPVKLTAATEWKYTAVLPVYEDGKQIQWTIAEIGVPRYYSATYNQSTLTVINTIQSKDIPKTGDPADLLYWSGLMVTFALGAAAVLFFDNKKKKTVE